VGLGSLLGNGVFMRSRESQIKSYRFRRDEKQRQVNDIDAMIADLMRKYDDLDQQVRTEEQRTGVTDPNHFNYSMSAKATRGRRDNLMRSVNELREQLAVAQNGLNEAAAELRKAELLAEKETGGQALILPATVAHAMR
jgi:flagellar protein FliJ